MTTSSNKIEDPFIKSVTNCLIQKIEQMQFDRDPKWFKSFNPPKNIEGRYYKGGNALLLAMMQESKGWVTPVYTTFIKAKNNGISVLKGEKATPIWTYVITIKHRETGRSISSTDYELLSKEQKKEYKEFFFIRTNFVFNIDQTNIREMRPDLFDKFLREMSDRRQIEQSNQPLLNMIEHQSWICPIHLREEREAYFLPSSNEIYLPKREYFVSDPDFYSILLHEMTHSTGIKDVLDRDLSGVFGSESYGREELVAELSSAVSGLHLGVTKMLLEKNAYYLSTWLECVKENPSYLEKILVDVSKASNLIIGKVMTEGLTKELNQEQTIDEITKDIRQEKRQFLRLS